MFDDVSVLAVLEQVSVVVAGCAAVPVWSVGDAELVAVLDAVHAAEASLAAVKARVVHELGCREVPAKMGASGTQAFVRDRLRVSPPAAKRVITLGAALGRLPVLAGALGAGVVNVEQATVIVEAVGALPDGLPAGVVASAEALLVGFAGELDPWSLRKVGERILTHVAPEIAERAEAQALDRAEKRATAGRALHLTTLGQSRVRVSGWLDADGAAVVNAALDPLCRPTGADDRTPAQRRADALVEVCELAMRTTDLPDNGGDRPQVVVTVRYDDLLRQLGAGTLDTGERLSATEVRRMCCDATILPATLGSAGELLDLGRTRRLITGAVRRVLVLRDRGCAFPSCDRPARWCDGHHLVSWIDGGPTCPDNSVLLCRWHHTLIHHSDWQVRLAADGLPEFIPPSYVDPERRPRRNRYHPRL